MDFLIVNWDVNPEIFRIGSFAVRWYGLLFATGFLMGYMVLNKIFKNENMPEDALDRLTVYMAIGVIIGARLGHCLFYEPKYYLSNPGEILKIWHGGLASHGGAIGILLAVWFFVKKEKKSYAWGLDRVAIVVPLAGFFIRMGNLMNSEIYGIETTLPWGFVFLRNGENAPKHPTQIYEALTYLSIFILMYNLYWRKKGKHREGTLLGIACTLIFLARFFIEFIKENQVDFESGMFLNMGQLLSIPFMIFGICWYLYFYRKNKIAVFASKPPVSAAKKSAKKNSR